MISRWKKWIETGFEDGEIIYSCLLSDFRGEVKFCHWERLVKDLTVDLIVYFEEKFLLKNFLESNCRDWQTCPNDLRSLIFFGA